MCVKTGGALLKEMFNNIFAIQKNLKSFKNCNWAWCKINVLDKRFNSLQFSKDSSERFIRK